MITSAYVQNQKKCQKCDSRGVCEASARRAEAKNVAVQNVPDGEIEVLELPRLIFNEQPDYRGQGEVVDANGIELLPLPTLHFEPPAPHRWDKPAKPEPPKPRSTWNEEDNVLPLPKMEF